MSAPYTLINTFLGEQDNPLLAPRGAYLHKKILVVSDTGQNRIFIWKDFQQNEFQSSDIILGHSEINERKPSAGATSASSLKYPSAVWTNGEMIIVADAWNHRVLIWNQMPKENSQPADIVVGQPDFTSNQPNVYGIGIPPGPKTLNWPYGVFSNGTALWIADTGNRRILYFEKIPVKDFAAATAVIGQNSFEEKDYNNENAVWPYSVKINSNGSMAIADTQFFRVLYWHHWQNAFQQNADIIFGQNDFLSNGQNQYSLKPNARTLNWVYDCCFTNDDLAIADTGNSRIILHNESKKNNQQAVYQIGQPDFETHGETSLSFTSAVKNEMYWPFAINAFEDILVVADTGNHRILFYKKKNDQ